MRVTLRTGYWDQFWGFCFNLRAYLFRAEACIGNLGTGPTFPCPRFSLVAFTGGGWVGGWGDHVWNQEHVELEDHTSNHSVFMCFLEFLKRRRCEIKLRNLCL